MFSFACEVLASVNFYLSSAVSVIIASHSFFFFSISFWHQHPHISSWEWQMSDRLEELSSPSGWIKLGLTADQSWCQYAEWYPGVTYLIHNYTWPLTHTPEANERLIGQLSLRLGLDLRMWSGFAEFLWWSLRQPSFLASACVRMCTYMSAHAHFVYICTRKSNFCKCQMLLDFRRTGGF